MLDPFGDRSEARATYLLSGDHAGSQSLAGFDVSRGREPEIKIGDPDIAVATVGPEPQRPRVFRLGRSGGQCSDLWGQTLAPSYRCGRTRQLVYDARCFRVGDSAPF